MKTALALLLFVYTAGMAEEPTDSAQSMLAPARYRIKMVARMHSLGLFSYGGMVASDYAAADFNLTYDRKNWGFMLFKAADLYDHRSPNNFSLLLLYRTFHIGKQLTITPYAGFSMEQSFQLADKGSDATMVLTTAYRFTKHLSIDHSAMFSNLALERDHLDWTNRFRMLLTTPHLDVGLILWHNNRAFDQANHMSTGFNLAYSRIKITDYVLLSTGITGLWMLQTSDELHTPMHNGLMFTIAGTLSNIPVK